MKYAVTGGAGFIGSHLVKNLVEHGNEIIVIDNLNTGKMENIEKFSEKINFFKVDIRDFSAIEGILKNVDGIFLISVVQNINLACSGGSSNVFSNALKALLDNICTSSIINILYLQLTGLYFILSMISRISSL